jgi:hypothetical protein
MPARANPIQIQLIAEGGTIATEILKCCRALLEDALRRASSRFNILRLEELGIERMHPRSVWRMSLDGCECRLHAVLFGALRVILHAGLLRV